MQNRQTKYYILELFALYIIIIAIIISGIIFSLTTKNNIAINLTLLIILWCLTAFYFRYLNKIGFSSNVLPPNIFIVKNVNYEKLFTLLSTYFNKEIIKITDKQDEKSSYILAKKKGMNLRILLIKLNEFDRDIFKQIKSKSNRIINEKNEISNYVTLNQVYKMERINFIIINKHNNYSKEFVNRNANISFARLEGILNIVLCEEEGILYIPTHFGLNNFMNFYKLYKIVLNCLQINSK